MLSAGQAGDASGVEELAPGCVVPDERSDIMIDGLLACFGRLAGAKAAAFAWIEPTGAIVELSQHNIPASVVENYPRCGQHDPLHITSLIAQRRSVATLAGSLSHGTEWLDPCYRTHLRAFDIGDELDLLVYAEETPLACMALFRSAEDPHFADEAMDWTAVAASLPPMLALHWRMRARNIETGLAARGLTRREREILSLLVQGASNHDVAELLAIGLTTVKTHMANILVKLGVDSRLAAVALVNSLQYRS